MPGRALSDGTLRVPCSLFWVVEQKREWPVGASTSSCKGDDGLSRGCRGAPRPPQQRAEEAVGAGTGWVGAEGLPRAMLEELSSPLLQL